MTDPLAFILAALALLATPGPTNTLLATSGAAAGLRRSLHLILAEVAGYMTAIITIGLVVAPLVRGSSMFETALRLACGGVLIVAAWGLWRESATAGEGRPVSLRRVFLVTMTNPKALVFTYIIVPFIGQGRLLEAAPYLGGLCSLIALVGAAWIAAGASVHATAKTDRRPMIVRRIGALVLCVFAVMISATAFSS